MAHQLYESLRFSPSTRAKHHFVRNACLTSDSMIVPGQTPKSQGHTHAGSLQVRFPRLRRDAQPSPQPTPQRYCRTKLLNLQKKIDTLTFVHQCRNAVVFCCFCTFHAAKPFRNGRGTAFTVRFLHQIHWFPGRCCDNATQQSTDRCFQNVCWRRRKEVWGIAFHVPQWTGVEKEVSQARVTSMSESPSSGPKGQHNSSAAAAKK